MSDYPVNERLAASMLDWWKDGAKGCDSALHEVTSLLRHLSRDGFVITDVRGAIRSMGDLGILGGALEVRVPIPVPPSEWMRT